MQLDAALGLARSCQYRKLNAKVRADIAAELPVLRAALKWAMWCPSEGTSNLPTPHPANPRPASITVGRLGRFQFPAGQYIYTGSAKRNLEARIQRHLSKHKKLRWHIDYLLTHRDVQVVQVQRSSKGECAWNQKTSGKIIVPGFGASDCRAGCGSHFQHVG